MKNEREAKMKTKELVCMGIILVFVVVGCQTGGQTGALVGSGIGAVAGQLIGGDTGATLVGAGVGAGVGYIIGNEKDKKHASEMSQAQSAPVPTHNEVGQLGGTRWNLISLYPKDTAKPYTSRIVEFKTNGRVVTTSTKPDGKVEVAEETYRVVGNTLIVNRPGYLINARFEVSGNQLTVSAENFSAVLQRI